MQLGPGGVVDARPEGAVEHHARDGEKQQEQGGCGEQQAAPKGCVGLAQPALKARPQAGEHGPLAFRREEPVALAPHRYRSFRIF